MPPDEIARLRERAASGEPSAQYELGQRLLYGAGVSRDYAEAERWLRLAAAHDIPGAQFCLGYMYDEGKGFARDPTEAARWYEAAAARGDSDAQHNLALIKWHATGVRETAAQHSSSWNVPLPIPMISGERCGAWRSVLVLGRLQGWLR